MGMTQSGLQGPSVRRWLLCSLQAHLSPCRCFSTTLLTPSIHSRPTEPVELRESTSHSGNLWEFKNTHISNCALHTVQRELAPSDPHKPFISVAHMDVYLRHLMAFPDRTLVCLYLMFFLFCFSSASFSLTQIFINGNPQEEEEERMQMSCCYSVCCAGLMLL